MPEARLMAEKLGGIGLTSAAWIEESESEQARENGQLTRALFEGSGVQSHFAGDQHQPHAGAGF